MKVIKAEKGIVKMWTDFVPVESAAIDQLRNVADMPFIHKHVAAMPDVHVGRGATIGSVIPTKGAIIPSAVGVDIGCGMMAVKTSLTANDLPDSLASLRLRIEEVVPVGFNMHNSQKMPKFAEKTYKTISDRLEKILAKHPAIVMQDRNYALPQMGTLGGGNHFVEVCLDTEDSVWIMLHSGSRGIGNRIGNYFIDKAKELMETMFIKLKDQDLAYLSEGTELFDDYIEAMQWAQEYAALNRTVMMEHVIQVMKEELGEFNSKLEAINCHHNYVARENHFRENVWLTRKGAVNAREGVMGIIPGSMGAKSFIVKGRGNKDSFCSCSHGAGRVMSRSKAKELVNLDEHIKDTEGVECRKDAGVLDETPKAYKNIDDVMKSQEDLVEIVYQLKQVLCVKG